MKGNGVLINKDLNISYSGVDIKIHAMITKEWYMFFYDNIKKQLIEENEKFIDETSELYANDVKNRDLDNPAVVPLFHQYNERNQAYSKITQEKLATPIYVELGEVQTLSYSVYRDKAGVPVLGEANPVGFTRAGVTLAGTMIFTVFKDRILHELFSLTDSAGGLDYFKYMRLDQLPPIDIFVMFQNEKGAMSRLGIFGVEFLNEGQVMSVADLITENSVNYVARHISPMRSVYDDRPDLKDMLTSQRINGIQLAEADYALAKEEIKLFRSRFL